VSYTVRIPDKMNEKANDLAVEVIQETGDASFSKRQVIEKILENGWEKQKIKEMCIEQVSDQ